MVTGEAAEGGDGGGRHQDQQQDRQLVQHHVVLRLAPRATRWRAVLITADNAAANRVTLTIKFSKIIVRHVLNMWDKYF